MQIFGDALEPNEGREFWVVEDRDGDNAHFYAQSGRAILLMHAHIMLRLDLLSKTLIPFSKLLDAIVASSATIDSVRSVKTLSIHQLKEITELCALLGESVDNPKETPVHLVKPTDVLVSTKDSTPASEWRDDAPEHQPA